MNFETVDGTRSQLFVSSSGSSIRIAHTVVKKAATIMNDSRMNHRKQELQFILWRLLSSSRTKHVFALAADCSRAHFQVEKESCRGADRREAALLFVPSQIQWKGRSTEQGFEAMTQEFTLAERGALGSTTGTNLRTEGDRRFFRRVGHAKSLSAMDKDFPWSGDGSLFKAGECRGVGKSDVRDIYDCCDIMMRPVFFWSCRRSDGGLADYLKKLRYENGLWADWWTRSELEQRLRRHTDIAEKFPDIVMLRKAAR